MSFTVSSTQIPHFRKRFRNCPASPVLDTTTVTTPNPDDLAADILHGAHAIADYIADDYQVGHKLHALGLRNVISEVVVSTRLSSGSVEPRRSS